MRVCTTKFVRSITLCFVLCLCFTQAAPAADDVLTVAEAVRLAKSNSVSLQIAKLTYANDEIAWNKAVNSNLTPLAERDAALAWEKAQTNLRTAESDLLTNVLSAYLAIQNASLTLSIREKQAAQADRLLAKQQILAEKGSVGPADVLNAQIDAMESQNSLDQAREAYDAAVARLQRLLGIDTVPVLPTESVLQAPEIGVSLADAIAAGLANYAPLKDQEYALEKLKITRAQNEAIGLAPMDDAKSLNDLKKAELQLAETKADRIAAITSQYNSLVHRKKSYELQLSSYQLSLRQFDIAQKQVEAGIKNVADLENDKISLLSAQQSLNSAEQGYINDWIAFQKTLGNQIDLSEVVKNYAEQ